MEPNGMTDMKVKKLSFFETYLSLWVLICIAGGLFLGKTWPQLPVLLNTFSVYQVSLPIALCLFFMMFPIMVKIDFTQIARAARTPKPVLLTLVVNWAIKPFSMLAVAYFFVGVCFRDYLPGWETLANGETVALWRSYIAGLILLGIAPCTAMVLMWGHLARGNDGLTLVMVALNSVVMLFLYGPLGRLLLNVNAMPVPWHTMLFSVSIYVALPLAAGYGTRRGLLAWKGRDWFEQTFLPWLTPVSVGALLVTLILLFSFKGDVMLANPLTIVWLAIPLLVQTLFIYALSYFVLARKLNLTYHDAAPAALIGASNHFEVAIATAVMLFGLSSGAALATVVGVLIEVPVMLLLVKISRRSCHWFRDCSLGEAHCQQAVLTAEGSTPSG